MDFPARSVSTSPPSRRVRRWWESRVEGMRQLSGFPNVRELGIGGHDFPPECLALLPELFPKATVVDFNHTFRIDEVVFEAFKAFENLEKLNLGGCYKSDEATMRAVGGLTDLQHLSVFHAGPYQWATLEALRGHPNLRSFRIGDSGGRPGRIRSRQLRGSRRWKRRIRRGKCGFPTAWITGRKGRRQGQLTTGAVRL